MLTNEQQWQHCPLQHVKQTTGLHPALEKQAKEKKTGRGRSRKAIRSCLKADNKYINKTGAIKSHPAAGADTILALQQGSQ